ARCLVQQADRVVVAPVPAIGVDRLEHILTVGHPRPRVVVCNVRQWLERLGEPGSQVGGGARDVLGAVLPDDGSGLGHEPAMVSVMAAASARAPAPGPSGWRNTAVPATSTSAPASTQARALAASTPPSTSTSVSSPWRVISPRTSRTLISVR